MKPPDDAIYRTSGHLQSISSNHIETMLDDHVSASRYLLPSVYLPKSELINIPDQQFNTNEDIWKAVVEENLKRTDRIISLDNFWLFEWLPRSPGLYHTVNARRARENARKKIISMKDGFIVYDPYGKQSMLDGGVGTVRLRPINIESNLIYLVSASSSGSAHEGFPVGLPENIYNNIIEELNSSGAIRCNLIGHLKFIPQHIDDLYHGYRNIPKVYLMIEEIRKSPQKGIVADLGATVAASFISEYEGETKAYATYVTFDPRKPGSFKERVEWMENDYVSNLYHGRIITDFDQQISHFDDAPFSLNKVMTLQLQSSELQTFGKSVHIHVEKYIKHQTNIKGALIVNNKNTIKNSPGSIIGRNININNFSPVWNTISHTVDWETLEAELLKLRNAVRSKATETMHDLALGELAQAETAIKTKDGPKLLQHLATAGKWVLDVAKEIGTDVLASVIKKSMGMS